MASSIPGQPFTISAGAQRKVRVSVTKTVNGVTSPIHATLSGQAKVGNSGYSLISAAPDPSDPDVLVMRNPAATAVSKPDLTMQVTATDPLSNVGGSETIGIAQLPKPTITVTIESVGDEEPIPAP